MPYRLFYNLTDQIFNGTTFGHVPYNVWKELLWLSPCAVSFKAMIPRWWTLGNVKLLHESLLIVARVNQNTNTTFASLLHRLN